MYNKNKQVRVYNIAQLRWETAVPDSSVKLVLLRLSYSLLNKNCHKQLYRIDLWALDTA